MTDVIRSTPYVNQTVHVKAVVIAVDVGPLKDLMCMDEITGSKFQFDPTVSGHEIQKLKIGDKFEALVSPCEAVYAIVDLIHGPKKED